MQASRTADQARLAGERGYAMAALIVGLAIMGLMASITLPVWTQAARREKEAELVFRGEQYARAIGLFQRKMGPGTLPPNLDVLVDQRFLRKRFMDPITGKDFRPVNAAQVTSAGLSPAPAGTSIQTGTSRPGGAGPGGTQGRSSTGGPQNIGGLQGGGGVQGPGGGARAGGPGLAAGQGQGGVPPGGVAGVVSSSTAPSLRLYNGRDRYDQWAFVYNPQTAVTGGAAGGVTGGGAGAVGAGGVRGGAPAGGARVR